MPNDTDIILLDLRLFDDTQHILEVDGQENLARAIWLHDPLPAPHLCGGLGRCGLCKVKLEAYPGWAVPPPLPVEQEVLGAEAESGWRLACRHQACNVKNMTIRIPAAHSAPSHSYDGMTNQSTQTLRLAVDLGTTTIHWEVLDEDGNAIQGGQCLNPQSGAGSDVMSRLEAAAQPETRRRMSERVRALLSGLIADLEKASLSRVVEMCLAANTAMTSIFLDLESTSLLAFPYRKPLEGGKTYHMAGLPPIWIPPQPAPFVGGDLAAGMAWALAEPTPFPFLLADMGTNGECVLALDAEQSLATSVPLGPALEGIGLSCGGLAGPGSATGFSLGSKGLTAAVWGEGPPHSLSGTGVLSLLDTLIRAGVLSPSGMLLKPSTPLNVRLLASVIHEKRGWRLPLPGNLHLSADDVERVLQVRAAFAVAVTMLAEAAGLHVSELKTVLIAGSLGASAPVPMLERLGFIPQGLADKTKVVGNTSLAGAALLLHHPEWRQRIIDWTAGCSLVDVTSNPDFMNRFTRAMSFS